MPYARSAESEQYRINERVEDPDPQGTSGPYSEGADVKESVSESDQKVDALRVMFSHEGVNRNPRVVADLLRTAQSFF